VSGNKLPDRNVAAGRKPSGFATPDGLRRSAKSVINFRTVLRAIAAPIIFSEISFSCIIYKSSAVLSVLGASALKFALLAKPIASSPGK